VIFEKSQNTGGLCNSFKVKDFVFDKFIHLSFTENEYVKELFSTSSDYFTHVPKPFNYSQGIWIKHPLQNNLFKLPVNEKVKIIADFCEGNKETENICNYQEWLEYEYGKYFTENYPKKYTRKYWTVEPAFLETKWIGKRMNKPKIEDVLYGSFTEETGNNYYAKEMRYPKRGGYKSFLKYMENSCDIRKNKKAVEIDVKKNNVSFEDGTKEKYDVLVSSLPLDSLCSIINECPGSVMTAADDLQYTSGVLVSLGLKQMNIPDCLWVYIYDEDVLPARINFPSIKSKNNAPNGFHSLQAEIYFSKYKQKKLTNEEILDLTIRQLEKISLFSSNDIIITDVREEKYANVLFDHNIYKNRKIVHEYLNSVGINYIGRFGEWDYLWSDQSLLSGKNVAVKLQSEFKGESHAY